MELEVNNLTKEFGKFTAVNNLNITMRNGVYGLLGINGAGKTTFMRMLCTLLRPTHGKITCNGKEIFTNGWGLQENIRVSATGFWILS